MIAPRRSFTLLEMLVVASLLGLLAAMGMQSLLTSPPSPTHTLSRIAAIDAEARLIARSNGPSLLTIESSEHDNMTLLALSTKERSRRFQFNGDIEIESGLTEIAFDRHGQSVDYTVSVAGSSRTLRVAGLTGWSEIDGE